MMWYAVYATLCAVWWFICISWDSDSYWLFSSAIIAVILISDIPVLIILSFKLHAFFLTYMLYHMASLIRCNAIRGGITSNILAEDLVPGDVIQLMSGDRVPADCRVLMCTGELCRLYVLYFTSTQLLYLVYCKCKWGTTSCSLWSEQFVVWNSNNFNSKCFLHGIQTCPY